MAAILNLSNKILGVYYVFIIAKILKNLKFKNFENSKSPPFSIFFSSESIGGYLYL